MKSTLAACLLATLATPAMADTTVGLLLPASGNYAGTHHFRNIHRHDVATDPTLLTLRVDESLFFTNARFLEDLIQRRVTEGCAIRNVVLMFSAVNAVDYSALESLEAINHRLRDMGVGLHLSEVKGPVMDRLKRAHLLGEMNGWVFLSQYDAWQALARTCPARAA